MIHLRENVHERLRGLREQGALSAEERRAFEGQRVMITGAGGAIGAELARQVASCRPSRLTLFDQSEERLFRVEQELASQRGGAVVDAVLGDVRRHRSVRGACRAARPHVVYHAAAYTHVAVTERNVCAAVEANVLGTLAVIGAARDLGARMVLVSSAAAARPGTVVGAAARLAELALLMHAAPTFRPVVVRFADGVPQPARAAAASLLLKADLLGGCGETYWLDVARTGADAGREDLTATAQERVWTVAQEAFEPRTVRRVLRALREDVAANDAMSALADLCAVLPGYQPTDEAWKHAAACTVTTARLAVPAGPVLSIHHAAASPARN
jgi:NAD(P)-dependent dehydrogenase (short-subunit alcohol dehydrogenase family)